MTSGEKAAATKKANAHARIWDSVTYAVEANNCRCGLQYGMTWDDLRPLGGGCTDPQYCCPALDRYRRETDKLRPRRFTKMPEGLRTYMKLFDGRKDAYGTGEGRWIKKNPRGYEYMEHVLGRGPGLGIAPLMNDGTCRFAAIDLDEPDFAAARDMQQFLPGTSWVERSRSGNAHVWCFFSDPIQAWIVRGIMKEAILAAGKGAVEIFPKQDALMAGMLGNYINLPYYGDDRPVLKPDGSPMEFLDFIREASENRNDPVAWRKRAEWLMILPPEKREPSGIEFGEQPNLHICAEHIISMREDNPVMEGHRSVVYFSLAKMLLNYQGFDEDEAWYLMGLVNEASPDCLSESELRRIFNNAHRGQFTSTGCDDVLMAPYCHPDCPIAFPKGSR